ncbi:MAG: phosphate transport system protein [Solirubrobacteraceae bacterium]|nr:phosphate transport system protein [Solirubrobacteraceae bacterium]
MLAPGQGRQHFQGQMLDLERSALGGMDMALGQVERVLDALEHADQRLAQFVIADDDRIDGRYLEVHQGVLSLLALQAPVAGDLRVVAAVLYVINSIERVGDQCVNIAKLIPLAGRKPDPPDELCQRILRMGELARQELAQARRAFADRDVALAQSLAEQDLEVNRLNREIFRLAVRAGADPRLREWAMTMTLAARALERIGDNAVDIAEQAIFMATGELRELSPPLHSSPPGP